MHLHQLNIYPIKSTHPISLNSVEVKKHSFACDREWALFGADGQVVTGRTHPQLLDIKCKIAEDELHIYHQNNKIGLTPLSIVKDNSLDLKIFSYDVNGYIANDTLSEWFSDFLNIKVSFIKVNHAAKRPVLAKHGGSKGDVLAFGDQAPVLILSLASLNDLNERLEEPIGTERFRPNIVLDDCAAFDEDRMKMINIGACKFKIIQPCVRCVFTTIDPITKTKHPKAEPLKTLASYRKGPRGGVIFGVHAVPLNEGIISLDDKVQAFF